MMVLADEWIDPPAAASSSIKRLRSRAPSSSILNNYLYYITPTAAVQYRIASGAEYGMDRAEVRCAR